MKTSKAMTAGFVFGILGGLVAMFSLVYCYYTPDQFELMNISLSMLSAVLFFAIAGAFTKTGQWSQNILMFMAFVTAGIMVAGTFVDYYPLWFGIIETAIAALIIAVASSTAVKRRLEVPLRD